MENPVESDQSVGGLGAGLASPGRTTINLIRRAIEGGWNVPDQVKRLSIDEMRMILLTAKSKRLKVSAVKALIAADANDLKYESINKPLAPPVSVNVQQNNVTNIVKKTDEEVERSRTFFLGVVSALRNAGSVEADSSRAGSIRMADGQNMEPDLEPSPRSAD